MIPGSFLIYLDMTVVNVALPAFREQFGLDLGGLQWIISIYVLAMGVSTPLSGFLADVWGVRTTLVAGLGAFVIGSVLAGLAPGLGVLLAGRAFQGIGGGLASPLASAQLLRAFPPSERGVAFGVFGLVLIVAPATGPLVGGWFVDAGQWRWAFLINIPVGALGVYLSSRHLVDARAKRRPAFDALGALTCTVGCGALLYGSSLAGSLGWGDPATVLFFAIGAACVAVFVPHELWNTKAPLLDLRLYRSGTFASSSSLGHISVVALFGAEFLYPIYLQMLRGLSGVASGAILLPIALGAGLAMPLAGKLYDRVGPRFVVALGYALLVFNSWQMSQLDAATSTRWLVALSAVRGVAIGLTAQSTFASAMSVVAPEAAPRATALITCTRYVVQAMAVPLLATVASTRLSHPIPWAHVHAAAGDTGVLGLCDAMRATTATMDAACTESLRGLSRAYRATCGFAIVGLAVAVFLPGWPGEWPVLQPISRRVARR
ncbi:DHA2 family efflux MFS transporter permease subunit [Pendulispora albinea]|uniref:DHA2 family efflux MFS transporter permease subunit n=1 Tax=Pendulispora albinea TaxID=2741071 RepID=A0ABZ2LKS8_9BACT